MRLSFRYLSAGHGASIDLEKAAKAEIYNNLIVNCRVGLRIVNTADTTNSQYGNTYNYGDSLSVVDQFYSVGDATHPQTTDIPAPSSVTSQPAIPKAPHMTPVLR